jgi:NADP-dependent 3-hydroxy acid dehydrogenase YdfG
VKSFRGKVAAITGAGSGMGQAIARSLASQGCHIALSDINEANLQQTADSLSKYDVKISIHPLDVADRAAVESFAEDVIANHGQVHMVFNNAGVSVTDSVEHMSYDDMEWLMNINFWGVIYGIKSFLPHLQRVDDAHIINTSSIFGTIAVPSQSIYNASKFAVKGYTFALRQELADTHINVSCVQPGGVKTGIISSSRYVPQDNASATKEEFSEQFESMAQLTSEQAAEQILRGVLKNKAQILVGKDAKLAALIERILPTAYQKLIGKVLDNP